MTDTTLVVDDATVHDVLVLEPLPEIEQAERERCEQIIVSRMQGVFEFCAALRVMDQKRLYRSTHFSFEEYMSDVFDLSRQRGYQYIRFAEVVENVNNCLHPLGIEWSPKNEGQARELVGLADDELVEVVQAAIAESDGKVTASMLKKARKDITGGRVTAATEQAKTPESRVAVDPETKISDELEKAFVAFIDQVNVEVVDRGFKTTARQALLARLAAVYEAIAGNNGKAVDEICFERSSDRHKVLAAGFRMFRKDPTAKTINELVSSGWVKHSGPFQTIAAMDQAMDNLLKNSRHVQG